LDSNFKVDKLESAVLLEYGVSTLHQNHITSTIKKTFFNLFEMRVVVLLLQQVVSAVKRFHQFDGAPANGSKKS